MRKFDHINDNDVLVVERKKASTLTAGLIVFMLLVFIAGYFLGKKNALYECTQQLMHDMAQEQFLPASSKESSSTTEQNREAAATMPTDYEQDVAVVEHNHHNESEQYQAKLIGFGTHAAAQQFADRLKKVGIPTIVTKRTSENPHKNSKKRTITWYQVMTELYHDKEELEQLIAQIKKAENIPEEIKPIRIA